MLQSVIEHEKAASFLSSHQSLKSHDNMEVSDDENGESLMEGESKQSEPVSAMDANRVKQDKAVEEIQHLKSYLTQLFAQDQKEEYKENICYEVGIGCVLVPKTLVLNQVKDEMKAKDGTCELVSKAFAKLLPNVRIVHAYLPSRSSWFHVGVNDVMLALEKLAGLGVRRCLHYSCPGHCVPFRAPEFVRIDGIPASIVNHLDPLHRVPAVKAMVEHDIGVFCSRGGNEGYRHSFRVHNPRFMRRGGPGGSYSVGILTPNLTIGLRVREHFEGSFFDRVPIAAIMPNHTHTMHCYACQGGDHPTERCPKFADLYQLEGFTRAGMSLDLFMHFCTSHGGKFVLFKNALHRDSGARVFKPLHAYSLGVDRKFVFYFPDVASVESVMRNDDFRRQLDPAFEPIVRVGSCASTDIPLASRSGNVVNVESGDIPPVLHRAIGVRRGRDRPYASDKSRKDKIEADAAEFIAKLKSQAQNRGNSDSKSSENDKKSSAVDVSNGQQAPNVNRVEEVTSENVEVEVPIVQRAGVAHDESNHEVGDLGGQEVPVVDREPQRSEEVPANQDPESNDSDQTVDMSEDDQGSVEADSLSGLDLESQAPSIQVSESQGSSLSSPRGPSWSSVVRPMTRSSRKSAKVLGAKRDLSSIFSGQGSGGSSSVKALTSKFAAISHPSSLSRSGSGSGREKKRRRRQRFKKLERQSGSMAIDSGDTAASVSSGGTVSQLPQLRPSGMRGEGGLDLCGSEQLTGTASDHDTEMTSGDVALGSASATY